MWIWWTWCLLSCFFSRWFFRVCLGLRVNRKARFQKSPNVPLVLIRKAQCNPPLWQNIKLRREYGCRITAWNSVGLCLLVQFLLHSSWQSHCDSATGEPWGFEHCWCCCWALTVQLIPLFSPCTIAPSAWNQQWNCFLLVWTTVFNMGSPFFKISAALHGTVPVHGLCSCVLWSRENNHIVLKTSLPRTVSLQELSSFS